MSNFGERQASLFGAGDESEEPRSRRGRRRAEAEVRAPPGRVGPPVYFA